MKDITNSYANMIKSLAKLKNKISPAKYDKASAMKDASRVLNSNYNRTEYSSLNRTMSIKKLMDKIQTKSQKGHYDSIKKSFKLWKTGFSDITKSATMFFRKTDRLTEDMDKDFKRMNKDFGKGLDENRSKLEKLSDLLGTMGGLGAGLGTMTGINSVGGEISEQMDKVVDSSYQIRKALGLTDSEWKNFTKGMYKDLQGLNKQYGYKFNAMDYYDALRDTVVDLGVRDPEEAKLVAGTIVKVQKVFDRDFSKEIDTQIWKMISDKNLGNEAVNNVLGAMKTLSQKLNINDADLVEKVLGSEEMSKIKLRTEGNRKEFEKQLNDLSKLYASLSTAGISDDIVDKMIDFSKLSASELGDSGMTKVLLGNKNLDKYGGILGVQDMINKGEYTSSMKILIESMVEQRDQIMQNAQTKNFYKDLFGMDDSQLSSVLNNYDSFVKSMDTANETLDKSFKTLDQQVTDMPVKLSDKIKAYLTSNPLFEKFATMWTTLDDIIPDGAPGYLLGTGAAMLAKKGIGSAINGIGRLFKKGKGSSSTVEGVAEAVTGSKGGLGGAIDGLTDTIMYANVVNLYTKSLNQMGGGFSPSNVIDVTDFSTSKKLTTSSRKLLTGGGQKLLTGSIDDAALGGTKLLTGSVDDIASGASKLSKLGKLGKLGKLSKGLKGIPIAGLALGGAATIADIATADDKTRAIATNAGGWIGGLGAGAAAGAALGSVVPGVGTAVGGVVGGIAGAVGGEATAGWIYDNMDKIKKFGGDVGQWFSDIGGEMGNWISEKWTGVTDWVSELPGKFADSAKDSAGKMIEGLGYGFAWITNEGPKAFNVIIDWFKELPGNVSRWWDNFTTQFGTWMSDTGASIFQWASDKWTGIQDWVWNLPGNMSQGWDNLRASLSDWATNLGLDLSNWVSTSWTGIQDWAWNIPGNLAATKDAVVEGMKDFGASIVEGLKSGFDSAVDNVQGGFGWVMNKISSAGSWIKDKFQSGQDAYYNSHSSGIDAVPMDGYPAILHKGEMVIPASQANTLRRIMGRSIKPESKVKGPINGSNSLVNGIPAYASGIDNVGSGTSLSSLLGRDLTADQQAFLMKVVPGAVQGYRSSGILPSLTLSQAILESGWGQSELASKYNNYFGHKWFEGSRFPKATMMTTEYDKNGNAYRVNANWEAYSSPAEGVLRHIEWLSGPRYSAVKNAQNYAQAAQAVKDAGYATDPRYVKSLTDVIESLNLQKIDAIASGDASMAENQAMNSIIDEVNDSNNAVRNSATTVNNNQNVTVDQSQVVDVIKWAVQRMGGKTGTSSNQTTNNFNLANLLNKSTSGDNNAIINFR